MHRFCKFIWGIHSVPPNLCQLGHSSSQAGRFQTQAKGSFLCVLSMATGPSLIFCCLSHVWFDDGSLLEHVGDGVIRTFLPRHGLGHHHARFGYFWLTPYLELNYSTTEIDPSSNWIINRQELSWPQEHDTDASWQFRTSKKLIPIAVKLGSMMVLCFRMTLRASRESWGMLLLLPLLAKSTYRITPVNI